MLDDSQVYFQFKSAKEFDTITFQGAHIPLAKLKQAIVTQKKIKSTDFDLVVENAQTGEIYQNDTFLIPKNTSLVVKRVPVTKGTSLIPGLTSNQGSLNQIQQQQRITPQQMSDTFGDNLFAMSGMTPLMTNSTTGDESHQIDMLVNSNSVDWMPDRNPHLQPNTYQSRKQPPPNYVCHRCKKPGHYIQHCPTNGDPRFNIKTVRKPTGIPRSFLRQVAGPDDAGDGALSLGDGVYAVMEPNESEFHKITTQEKSAIIASNVDGSAVPDSIKCPICHQLFRDAVLLPCCGETFCSQCISNTLINETNFHCPKCHTPEQQIDGLIPNRKTREAVEEYKLGVKPVAAPATVATKIVDHFAMRDTNNIFGNKEIPISTTSMGNSIHTFDSGSGGFSHRQRDSGITVLTAGQPSDDRRGGYDDHRYRNEQRRDQHDDRYHEEKDHHREHRHHEDKERERHKDDHSHRTRESKDKDYSHRSETDERDKKKRRVEEDKEHLSSQRHEDKRDDKNSSSHRDKDDRPSSSSSSNRRNSSSDKKYSSSSSSNRDEKNGDMKIDFNKKSDHDSDKKRDEKISSSSSSSRRSSDDKRSSSNHHDDRRSSSSSSSRHDDEKRRKEDDRKSSNSDSDRKSSRNSDDKKSSRDEKSSSKSSKDDKRSNDDKSRSSSSSDRNKSSSSDKRSSSSHDIDKKSSSRSDEKYSSSSSSKSESDRKSSRNEDDKRSSSDHHRSSSRRSDDRYDDRKSSSSSSRHDDDRKSSSSSSSSRHDDDKKSSSSSSSSRHEEDRKSSSSSSRSRHDDDKRSSSDKSRR